MKTDQEIFDIVVEHLRKQGEKSEDFYSIEVPYQSCRYRAFKNGKILKCAAGCLIPDEEYSKSFEDHAAKYVSFFQIYYKKNLSLISALQMIHDFAEVENWETKFSNLANEFNLKYTSP